jgi:PAS domain S-box-containing protein
MYMISRPTAVRYSLGTPCTAAFIGAVLPGTELLERPVLHLSAEQLVIYVVAAAGAIAAAGLVLAWRVHQRGLAVVAAARQRMVAVEAARTELERLVTGLPVAVYQGNLASDGLFKRHYLTSSIVRVTGWSAEQIPNHAAFLGLVPSEDRPIAEAHYRHALRDGEATTDYRLKRPDGSVGWFRQQTRVAALTGDGADLIGTLSDITKKHALTEQVALDEARFRGFLESSPDALVITDRAGLIVMVSQRVEAVFGYKPEDIIGRPHGTLVPAHHRKAHAVHLRNFFDAPTVRDMGTGQELNGRRQDGSEFSIEVRLSPYHAPEGLFVIAAVRDITQRRQAEDQLRQAQKMEAVGELTGGVAHDFNNLLTTILGNAELLEWGDNKADVETTALIAAIRRAGQRGALLTQQMLAFSRKQPLQPEVTDLNLLISMMSDMLRQMLGDGITVKVAQASDLWPTLVDRNQFENAMLNVAINARDAMPDGGGLTIETSNITLDDDCGTADGELRAGLYVMIAVSDRGEGMTEETLQRAFEPFYTTKPVGHGTGLGLSQVYGFVKQSGGHIELYSEVGHGSTVRIYLPPHQASGAPEIDSASVPEPARMRGTETILVVEDEASVRDFSGAALTRLGYHVLAANGAAAALAIIAHEPEIALLFTDIGLPAVSGRKLADEARRRYPGLKVLFTTGYAPSGAEHDGALNRSVDLLAKPFTIDKLARQVRDILDRQ